MSTKEPFETRTLIGWVWKCSDAWSWPILIAREAWLYNTQAVVYKASIDSHIIKATWFSWKARYNEHLKLTQVLLLITHLVENLAICKTKQVSIPVVLATIARVNHLIPSRTQKWNLLALMVVWGLPCESKSSPAHYSKSPLHKQGAFFMRGVSRKRSK